VRSDAGWRPRALTFPNCIILVVESQAIPLFPADREIWAAAFVRQVRAALALTGKRYKSPLPLRVSKFFPLEPLLISISIVPLD
jgi:hypothetical protein